MDTQVCVCEIVRVFTVLLEADLTRAAGFSLMHADRRL